MRSLCIRLEVRDDALREALGELLQSLGHRVSGSASQPPDLVIRTEASPTPAAARPGVLTLRTERGQPCDRDAVGALRRVLVEGGEARWDSPLRAAALVEALGVDEASAASSSRERTSDPFATCAEPWLSVDTSRGVARPLNREAAERLAAGDEPWLALLPRVCAEAEGLVRCAAGGGAWAVACWWTSQPGTRLLAWLPWQHVEGLEEVATLRALAELGRISSTFAHEVRNPLASLSSALTLLGGDLPRGERAEVLALARSRLTHLRTMLDDTLRLVRAFRGPPTPVDLAEVVASALLLARDDAQFQAIELVPSLPAPAPAVSSYAEPLRQALTNLLLNAAEAQAGRGRIELHVSVRGLRVVLAVEDRGPGIPVEHHQRVFEPFWTSKPGGTGLGLAFVRRLAEASGGEARVGTSTGPGARMELLLPLASADLPPT